MVRTTRKIHYVRCRTEFKSTLVQNPLDMAAPKRDTENTMGTPALCTVPTSLTHVLGRLPSSKAVGADLNSLLDKVREHSCQASFRRIYELTNRPLFGIVHRIERDRDEAEEALQEAYVIVWSQCRQFDRTRGDAMAWMTVIAKNRAISGLRRQSRRPQRAAAPEGEVDPYERLVSPLLGPADILEKAQRLTTIQTNLLRLHPCQRQSLVLAFHDGLTYAEIAIRLGRPLGTVKSWIRRSFDILRGPLSTRELTSQLTTSLLTELGGE